jgi:hypothetical protein
MGGKWVWMEWDVWWGWLVAFGTAIRVQLLAIYCIKNRYGVGDMDSMRSSVCSLICLLLVHFFLRCIPYKLKI